MTRSHNSNLLFPTLQMRFCRSLSLLIAALGFCQAATTDLPGDFTSAGITAVFPGDPAYQADSQAYNLRFAVQPAAVTFPNTPQDVSTIVKIGATFGYPVVARSGGHSYIANGLGGTDGAIVIDLRNLKQITVNQDGTATIQPGNRLGDVASALNNNGRALPHGTCPYVGIGGHASHGGFGFTSRMWGLTLDTIQSLEVVLANGTCATLSANQYPDLFFAMRGAGPSFGVTTSFTVQTFPAPPSATVFIYTWNMNPTDAANAVSSFQKFAQTNLPPEFDAEFNFGKGNAQGQVSVRLVGGWYSSPDAFNAVIAPFLATVSKPDNVDLTVSSYIDSVTNLGGKGTLSTTAPDNTDTFYVKSLMTPPFPDAALLAYTNYIANQGFQANLAWFVQFELYGGTNSKINSVPLDSTAFGHRNSMWTLQMYASSPSFQPPYPDSGFTFLDDMANILLSNSPSNFDYGAYPNYADNMLPDWQHLYYASHYDKLVSIKQEYDPTNVFRFPESIGSQ